MDFSDNYLWDESENKVYNLDAKSLWIRNGQRSFENGARGFHNGKTINQCPIANCPFLKIPLQEDEEYDKGECLMADIGHKFRNVLKWWQLGWKTAYINHIEREKERRLNPGMDI